MHCYICYWSAFVAIWYQFWDEIFNFGCLSSWHYTYLCELGCEEGIYFSKPEGVREQNSFGNTGLEVYIAYRRYGAVSRIGSVAISVKK